MITHEAFIARVADLAIARLPDSSMFNGMKLVYGMGENGSYGVTYFKRWKTGEEPHAFVEIGARHQQGWAQIAGTVIHELGHVLAGWEAGHDKGWKEACERLGLRRARAVGAHSLSQFDPGLRMAIAALPKPTDGAPICMAPTLNPRTGKPFVLKPCVGGLGTRGGKSRGVGSGSRLLKFQCDGDETTGHKPSVVRASRGADFHATCLHCNTLFRMVQ